MAKMHVFDIALAMKYGPVESIILSSLCYWIEKNTHNQKNFREGRYWVYNSTPAFEKMFPYLNGKQIRRVLDSLREKGAVLTNNFNKIGYDRTLWYSVSDAVLKLYNGGKLEISKNPPPNTADQTGGNAEIEAFLPENAISPNGQMHIPNSGDASAQTGEWGNSPEFSEIPLPNTADQTGGNAEIEAFLPENAISPNGQMHFPNSGDASPGFGRSISQIRDMDVPDSADRSPNFGPPIPDINLSNPSPPDSAAEKELFIKSYKNLLPKIDTRLVFTQDFYLTLWDLHLNNDCRASEAYCRWFYRECLNTGHKENIRGYFYKVFSKPEMLELYLSTGINKNAPSVKPKPIHCPACGTIFDKALSHCPSCGLNADRMDNETAVRERKIYIALSDDEKNNYESELDAVTRMRLSLTEYNIKINEIMAKYELMSMEVTA